MVHRFESLNHFVAYFFFSFSEFAFKYLKNFNNFPNVFIEFSRNSKLQFLVPWTYVISCYVKDQEIVGTFYEKHLKKTNPKEFTVEKVIKRKCDKLYVKCKATIVVLVVRLITKT